MKKIGFDEMQQFGVMDYYLDLKKFIDYFIERNYPLTKEDFVSLVNGEITLNIEMRNSISAILFDKLEEILLIKKNENIEFLNQLNNGNYVRAISREEYEKEIFNFKQELLEELWNYRQSNGKNR